MSEQNEFEKAYSTNEIATLLQIGDSTLRKWCIELEKNGYHFIRDDNDNRAFVDHDVIVLRQLQEMTRGRKTTIGTAAMLIAERFKHDDRTDRTGGVPIDLSRSNERYNTLLEEVKNTRQEFADYRTKQEAFNQALLEQLKKQQEYIEKSIKARDEQLMKAIREIQEARLQLAAAEQEKKKKKWWRFWA
ncbi:DUF3967 domain-containing protein [Aneurinibacillus thermoaerophilus]|uniref:DUF3967 domain-containing protein n=1 Tax=Aneurinibacillus thermoaerophilus TaxID=143495 RepID=UPI002E1AB0EF|nr:DUF3967 domain-containing protein [Aneurinibacillus thermoaerophilus]